MNYFSFDIGGTNTRLSIISEIGEILVCDRKPTPKHEAGLAEIIDAFLDGHASRPHVSESIGVSVAGLYDHTCGVAVFPNAFEGRSIKVASLFNGKYAKKLRVSDDRTAGICGEKHFGYGKNVDEFAYLIIGTGVGLGIMKGKEILRGADFVAGSVGWIKSGFGDTYENVLSGPGIARYYTELTGKKIDAKEIFDRHIGCGDSNADATVRRTGEALGKLLAMVFNFANPELIVLSGSVSKQWEVLKHFSEEIIFQNISPYINTTEIKVSFLDDNSTLLGNVGRIINGN